MKRRRRDLVPSFGLLGRAPAFGAFWGARSVSLAGDALANVVLLLHVFEREGGGTSVGLLLVAQTVPRLLGPFAGAVADRTDQRRLLRGCELGQAILVGAMALWLPPFPLLLGVVAATAVLATVVATAGRGALPALVAGDDLPAANALLGSGLNLSLIIGPALGGVLAGTVGTRGTLGIDALSFLVSAALLARVPALPPARGASESPERLLTGMRVGWSYLLRHRTARAVAVGLFVVVAFGALDNVALVFLAREVLGADAAGFGAVAATYGAGMVLAPVALVRWGGRVPLAPVLLLGIALAGGGTLLTGLAPGLPFAAAAQGFAGAGNGLENVANETLIQRTVPRPMLGRVFGIVYGGTYVASGLAYAAGGPLLDRFSPRGVFLVAGGGMLVGLAIVWRLLPRGDVESDGDGGA